MTTVSCDSSEPFGYCLNTSTIKGQKLDLPTEILVATQNKQRCEISYFKASGGPLIGLLQCINMFSV